MKTRQISIVTMIGALAVAVSSVSTHAIDTDVYLKSQSLAAREDSPNVMIILDNSGSMNTVVTSHPPYDPLINYCTADLNATYPAMTNPNAGKPSNCAAIGGRIFWSFSGTAPTTSSNDWFDASKNNCFDSTSALSSSGRYSSSKIARWISGSNWNSLSGQTNSNITYVDCQRDNTRSGNGTADGTALNDGQSPRNSSTSAYISGTSSLFSWSGFSGNTSPTLYTPNYLNYINNAALQDDITRIEIAKTATKEIIDANPGLRFGLMVFNRNNSTGLDGGRVIFKIDTMDDARRTAMKAVVDSIALASNTPLAETLWEAYRYFSGNTVDFGDNDTGTAPARDMTAESGGTYISPFLFSCQKAYVIYITDGDPTNDSDANTKIQTRIGGNCDGSSCLDDLAGWMNNNDVYSGLPNAQKVGTFTVGFGTGISAAGLALLQETATQGGGQYYTAENGAQLSDALQGAIATILTETLAFTSPSLSINAFNRQFNLDDIYVSLFQPSNSCAWEGNLKKYRLCKQADITAGRCTSLGDVLDQNGVKVTDVNGNILATARSYWSAAADGADVAKGGAGENIPAPGLRNLNTYVGNYSGLTSPSAGVRIEVNASNAFYTAVTADPTLLGLPSTATTAEIDALVNWMRGQDSYDKNTNGSTTDNRWRFNDPLHSRSFAINYGGSSSNPIVKIFVGSNDGTIRMINNSTGVEEWAFMPKEMFGMQFKLSQDTNGDHLMGVDNTPSFWVKDINKDGIINPSAGDKVYMFISTRRGGRNIYGFDATPSSTMTSQSDTVTPKLMWVIQGGVGDFAKLGQTWSYPQIARIRYNCTGSVCNDNNPNTDDSNSRIVLMFAGGYDTNQDNGIPAGTDSMGNAIYFVDPLTGARIWWASSDAGATLVLPQMKYSIPSDLALVDSNGDGKVDRLYVGDTGGQLWRIDLGKQLAANVLDAGTKGFVFADVGCTGGTRSNDCAATSFQNRRKFLYPPAVASVTDATYSAVTSYDIVTIGSGDREDPLDFLTSAIATLPASNKEAVHNRIYAFRDTNPSVGAPSTIPAVITEAATDLYDATANSLGTLTGAALTAEMNTLKSKKGWYIDLRAPSAILVPNGLTTNWVGEKVLAKTTLFNGALLVTTFTPANDTNSATTCDANAGVAMEYTLNALNATGVGDFNGDGVSDERSGQIGSGIPSEVAIVFRPDGTTSLISAGKGVPEEGEGVGEKATTRVYWLEE